MRRADGQARRGRRGHPRRLPRGRRLPPLRDRARDDARGARGRDRATCSPCSASAARTRSPTPDQDLIERLDTLPAPRARRPLRAGAQRAPARAPADPVAARLRPGPPSRLQRRPRRRAPDRRAVRQVADAARPRLRDDEDPVGRRAAAALRRVRRHHATCMETKLEAIRRYATMLPPEPAHPQPRVGAARWRRSAGRRSASSTPRRSRCCGPSSRARTRSRRRPAGAPSPPAARR